MLEKASPAGEVEGLTGTIVGGDPRVQRPQPDKSARVEAHGPGPHLTADPVAEPRRERAAGSALKATPALADAQAAQVTDGARTEQTFKAGTTLPFMFPGVLQTVVGHLASLTGVHTNRAWDDHGDTSIFRCYSASRMV